MGGVEGRGNSMTVREAVATAKTHLQDLFQEEHVANLGLEEVEFDEDHKEWRITLGFSRPWDREPVGPLFDVLGPPRRVARARDLKLVRIRDNDGKVISIKNHE
jgi:hypothetical protein